MLRGKKCLMNKEEPYRDQAERLKRRIEKINEITDENDLLPPREQVHRQKKKKTKIKLKYPVIRLLVLFFILLPIIYFSVISYLDGKKFNPAVKTGGNSVGYEEININNNSEKKDVPKPKENSASENKSGVVTQTDKTESDNQNTNTDTNNNTNDINTNSTNTNTNTNTQTNSTSNTDTNQTTTKENVQSNSTPQKAVTSTKIIYHTVKPQETLYKIAMKYYNSMDGVEIIKKANHLKSEQISAGQVLKIPLKN
jgi:LysM repeat protein